MTVLTYTLGVLLFAVGVAASIGLHEAGHLIPGKLFNVKVTQFFVGFGRTLWSRQKGETEYGLKAIPLGGYCKLIGMVPARAGRGTRPRAQPQHRDVRPARQRHPHGGVRARRARGPRPAVLQQALVAADHHHGLRRGHQPGARLLPVRDRLHGLRHPAGDHHGPRCLRVRHRRHQGQRRPAAARLHRRRPGGAGQGGGLPARRHDRLDQRRPRSPPGPRPRRRSGPTATRRRRSSSSATASRWCCTPRPRSPRPTWTRTTRRRSPRSASSAWSRRPSANARVSASSSRRWPTAPGRPCKTIAALPDKVYHVGRAALGLEERDPNGPMSVVGAGRVAGEMASEKSTPGLDRFFSVILLLAGPEPVPRADQPGPAPALRRRRHRHDALRDGPPRDRAAARQAGPRRRGQRQAAARDLRDGCADPGAQRGADLRRHRRARLAELTQPRQT